MAYISPTSDHSAIYLPKVAVELTIEEVVIRLRSDEKRQKVALVQRRLHPRRFSFDRSPSKRMLHAILAQFVGRKILAHPRPLL